MRNVASYGLNPLTNGEFLRRCELGFRSCKELRGAGLFCELQLFRIPVIVDQKLLRFDHRTVNRGKSAVRILVREACPVMLVSRNVQGQSGAN